MVQIYTLKAHCTSNIKMKIPTVSTSFFKKNSFKTMEQ